MSDASAQYIVNILIAGGIGFILTIIWCIFTYNRFVRIKANVRESWSNIDVQLKRRHDLIPQLVEVAKGYAKHEKSLFETVAQARHNAVNRLEALQSNDLAERELVETVNRMMLLAEDYPELKADQHFRMLQKELALTEDRIAACRRFYNANVREHNVMIETFPSKFIANGPLLSYFEVSEVETLLPSAEINSA